jgi:hypothetical protein
MCPAASRRGPGILVFAFEDELTEEVAAFAGGDDDAG